MKDNKRILTLLFTLFLLVSCESDEIGSDQPKSIKKEKISGMKNLFISVL